MWKGRFLRVSTRLQVLIAVDTLLSKIWLMRVFLFFVPIMQSPKVVPEHLFDYVVPQLEPFDQRMAIVKACIDAGPKYFFLKLLSVSKRVGRIRNRTADD